MRNVLYAYTIFERPTDFPTEFVCRTFHVRDGKTIAGEIVARGATLDAVREQLPPGLFNVGRYPQDDAKIVETWI